MAPPIRCAVIGEVCKSQYYNFPKAYTVKLGHFRGEKFRLRIDKPMKPDHFTIRYYEKIKDGKVVGEKRYIARTLVPVENKGKVRAWDAYFRLNKRDTNYLLVFRADWKRPGGNDPTFRSYGDLTTLGHVRTK